MRLGWQEINEFLLDHGASRLPHPGGTLHEHLVRVAALLAEWDAGQDLQAAGLCHACYGTAGFDHALLGLDERPVLRALVGARAESLVYLYGSCDRAVVYPALKEPGPVSFRDRFTGAAHTPPERDVRAFTELTAPMSSTYNGTTRPWPPGMARRCGSFSQAHGRGLPIPPGRPGAGHPAVTPPGCRSRCSRCHRSAAMWQ